MFRLQRDVIQIILAILAAIATELFYSFLTEKNRQFSWKDRCVSAIVPCAGLLLYMRSREIWFYALAVFIAISSKYLLRYRKNSSIFNPIAFSIVFCLSVLPTDLVFIKPDQFSVDTYPIIQCFILGIPLGIIANRWRLSLSFYATIFVIALTAHVAGLASFWWIMGPELSVLIIVFAFFMITEPKTSPTTNHGQIVFGIACAVLHLSFRYYEILYSEFLALFLMCAVRPFFEEFFEGTSGKDWPDVSNHHLLLDRQTGKEA